MASTTNDAYVDDRAPVFYAADVALFATIGDTVHVLLIRRGWDPHKGLWALPGGHVDAGESSRDAAARECLEETGIPVATADLFQVGVWDKPDRDARGRYVSVLYVATLDTAETPTAGDDATAATWVPVTDALAAGLAFDHRSMVDAARWLVSD
jgi:8-oxo-dGTP diphosphatase